MFDLIIIGGGPAGITAAIYAARKKMNFLLITKDIGGQANWSFEVDNYPGCRHVSGMKLMKKFEKHAKDYKIQMKLDEDTREIKKILNGFEVITNRNKYQTKTIIISSGKIPKRLNVPGEEKFLGSGVAYCAVCDAQFFKSKNVAIIGGANSALDAVFHLENIAKKIYLVNISSKLDGDEVLKEKVEKNMKVEILNNTKTIEIVGEDSVTGIKIEQNGKQKVIDVDGVFIEIGFIPNTKFVDGLIELNELGEIVVDKKNMTNVPGIFAAGDVTDVPEKQIIISAGDGAKALLSTSNYLQRMKE